jgi:hypothetical protein
LRQTPWYEFAFADTLNRLWRETPFESTSWVRPIERRISLSLEYGIKSIYALVIALAAGLSPAELKILTVVRGLTSSDLAADPRIALIERLADRRSVIKTPRYRAYTVVLQGDWPSAIGQSRRSPAMTRFSWPCWRPPLKMSRCPM